MSPAALTPNFPVAPRLPSNRGAYYGGTWHNAISGKVTEVTNPGTGGSLGVVADCGADDVNAAVQAAKVAFREWRRVPPFERTRILREIAQILRKNALDLAMIDAADCGNPVSELIGDVTAGAFLIDYFAGLVTEMKGHSVPAGPDRISFSVREPFGVVARIIPFNHPLLFVAAKVAAPLAAGNTVVMKPPEQAPLSALRFAELIDGLLPSGVLSIVPGGKEAGAALAGHPDVAMIALIGSAPTGRTVMRTASDTLKRLLMELGGKNALIAYPDADPDAVAAGLVSGMNFPWCGQSCGSTSRAFVHEEIYDEVLHRIAVHIKRWKPGIPTDPATTMGSLISRAQFDRVISFIESAKNEGARLIIGGGRPKDPQLANGFFIEPTVFADVTTSMRMFREEIFGPVVGIAKWRDEASMIEQVNAVEYGLTASIWTNDVTTAHRTASVVDAGYVWINDSASHVLGSPFGGYKQSGVGREECLEELLSFTQEKNIIIKLRPSGS